MRIGPLGVIILMAGFISCATSSAGAQQFYYGSGIPHIPAPAANDHWNNGSSCQPYWMMPFSYINDCDEYIPSAEDWNSPGRG